MTGESDRREWKRDKLKNEEREIRRDYEKV